MKNHRPIYIIALFRRRYRGPLLSTLMSAFTHILSDGSDDGGVGETGNLREGVGDAEGDGGKLGTGNVGVTVHEPARDGELVNAEAEGYESHCAVCALEIM